MITTKWMVSGMCLFALLFLKDAPTLLYIVGSLLNGTLAMVLKKVFRCKRPPTAAAQGKYGPGFPSQHAQSLFYLSVYLVLSCIPWPYQHTGDWHWPKWLQYSPILFYLCSALLASVTITLASLRVTKGYHSLFQVIGGAFFGSIFACLWRYFILRENGLQSVTAIYIEGLDDFQRSTSAASLCTIVVLLLHVQH